MDLQWWISAIEIPALAGLFWLLNSQRAATDKMLTQLHEEIASFKLHVATNYASLVHLKEVELRLTQHLLKIESKLDRVIERDFKGEA